MPIQNVLGGGKTFSAVSKNTSYNDGKNDAEPVTEPGQKVEKDFTGTLTEYGWFCRLVSLIRLCMKQMAWNCNLSKKRTREEIIGERIRNNEVSTAMQTNNKTSFSSEIFGRFFA